MGTLQRVLDARCVIAVLSVLRMAPSNKRLPVGALADLPLGRSYASCRESALFISP